MKKKIIPLLIIVFVSGIICSYKISSQQMFIVWGDTQFHNQEVFRSVLNDTNLKEPLFVLHTGDMIHGYTHNAGKASKEWVQFFESISELECPFYPTPGNHDITTKEMRDVYLSRFKKLYYGCRLGDFYVIVLNSFPGNGFHRLDDKQCEWLQAELKNNPSKYIFISVHSPLYLNEYREYDWSKVHKILKKYNVEAVFTGHEHIFDYRKIDGIHYFCLNTSGNLEKYNNHLAGRSYHYLEVCLNKNKIEYNVISKGRKYLPEDVLPDEYIRGKEFIPGNRTVPLIQTGSEGEYRGGIIIKNNTSGVRGQFMRLRGKIEEDGWKLLSPKKDVVIAPGETRTVEYTLSGKYINSKIFPGIYYTHKYTTQKGKHLNIERVINFYLPPVLHAEKCKKPPEIDGKIDENIWAKTETAGEFTAVDGQKAEDKTSVKVLYDYKNIYVAVRGEEPSPQSLSSKAHGKVPYVFSDDDFELYFDTNRDQKTFYRMMVNPAGTVLSSGQDGLFSFDFEVKTFIAEDSWSAEFCIPLHSLKKKSIREKESWGFNVRRHRQQTEPAGRDWSHMQQYPPYQPEFFGLLIFN